MGGQQSTRRITVINDEASGVIKISDSVVQRLKEEINQNSGQQQQTGNSAPPPPPPPQAAKPEPVPQPPAPEAIPDLPPPPPPPQQQQQQQQQQHHHQQMHEGFHPHRPIIQYVEREPSMSSLKVRAEKEKELVEAETYWKDRLHKMEHEHSVTSNLQASAFEEVTAKLEGRFLKARQPPVCEDARKAVIDCYKLNKGSSLLCSHQVRDFAKCVDSVRVGFLNRSG